MGRDSKSTLGDSGSQTRFYLLFLLFRDIIDAFLKSPRGLKAKITYLLITFECFSNIASFCSNKIEQVIMEFKHLILNLMTMLPKLSSECCVVRQWTKTRTPGGAGIKEHLLSVWWQCAKQLSQRICVDKSQLPEHLHFCLTSTEFWTLVPTSVFWDHGTHHLRFTSGGCFSDGARPSCLKVSSFPAAVKGAGKDGEDEWHRWPADTSREARLRQMSLVTVPNPTAQRSTVGLSWNQRRLASPQITRVTGLLKNNLLVMPLLLVSVRSLLFCFLPAWALFNWIQTSDYLVFKDIPGLAFRCRKQIMESIQPLGVLLSS